MAKTKKYQYHHCIPRFLLRQFQYTESGNASQQNDSKGSNGPTWISRQTTRSTSRRRLVPAEPRSKKPEIIHFYDISKGDLTEQPLGKVHGQHGLYRDPQHPTNDNHLEEKLSLLERQAATILRSMHQVIRDGEFTVTRAELATLRKFIFLMHYRNDSLASSFFEETNAHNAPLLDWLRQKKEKDNLDNNSAVWLDGLRYYLETPHHEIVATAERLKEERGQLKVNEMLRNRVDPESDDFYALEYEGLANYFFMGVWEAAPGTEFILGGNGFGLWEGLIYNTPGVHRLYVVSPRIVIVLRRTILWRPHANDPSVLHSCLADVEIPEPEVTFANSYIRQQAMEAPSEVLGRKLIDEYRRTSVAQGDTFTFEITKLTPEQTYAVNEVALLNSNVQDNGSITFSSPTCMLDTLRAYMLSKNTFLGGKKSLFNPLYETLSSMGVPPSSSGGSDSSGSPVSPLATDSDADRQFHVFLRYMVLQGITFPSDYNRSYLIYQMATTGPTLENAVSISIRAMVDEATAKLSASFPLPAVSRVVPHSLMETLPAHRSQQFFDMMGRIMDPLGVGKRSHDPLSTVAYEAAMIGVALWITSQRPENLVQDLQPFLQPRSSN